MVEYIVFAWPQGGSLGPGSGQWGTMSWARRWAGVGKGGRWALLDSGKRGFLPLVSVLQRQLHGSPLTDALLILSPEFVYDENYYHIADQKRSHDEGGYDDISVLGHCPCK